MPDSAQMQLWPVIASLDATLVVTRRSRSAQTNFYTRDIGYKKYVRTSICTILVTHISYAMPNKQEHLVIALCMTASLGCGVES